jgi:hypothetical protein
MTGGSTECRTPCLRRRGSRADALAPTPHPASLSVGPGPPPGRVNEHEPRYRPAIPLPPGGDRGPVILDPLSAPITGTDPALTSSSWRPQRQVRPAPCLSSARRTGPIMASAKDKRFDAVSRSFRDASPCRCALDRFHQPVWQQRNALAGGVAAWPWHRWIRLVPFRSLRSLCGLVGPGTVESSGA